MPQKCLNLTEEERKEKNRIYQLAWRNANREKCRKASREFSKRFRKAHPDYYLIRAKPYAKQAKVRHKRIKKECLEAYGGKCACCGESTFEFLTMDHINNNGAQHRKEIKTSNIYAWLRRTGYTAEGFRVLCWNCNCSRGFLGFCPHKGRPIEDQSNQLELPFD